MNLFDLSGRTAVITGGNSGIGLAFARGLIKSGADVAIWARNESKNAAAVEELEHAGDGAADRRADAADALEIADPVARRAAYGQSIQKLNDMVEHIATVRSDIGVRGGRLDALENRLADQQIECMLAGFTGSGAGKQ